MNKKLKFIAEQELVIWWSEKNQKRVTIRISEPHLEKHRDGKNAWACYPKADGLIDLEKPVYGLSSFQAVVEALLVIRLLLHENGKGAKFFMVDKLLGHGLFPDDGLSLKELFEID